jgi:hypothetical protein
MHYRFCTSHALSLSGKPGVPVSDDTCRVSEPLKVDAQSSGRLARYRRSMHLHLLVSVFVTDDGLLRLDTGKLDRGPGSRLDLLLTSLHSLRALPWSSAVIRIQLDTTYRHFSQDLEKMMLSWFPMAKYHHERLDTFRAWATEVNSSVPPESVTLLMANDDHALLPGAAADFLRIAQALDSSTDPRCMGLMTHHPEVWGQVCSPWTLSVDLAEGMVWTQSDEPIGTVLLRQELLQEWFREDFTGGERLVRPDNPFGPSVSFEPARCAVPLREVMRHLDGYSHVGIRKPAAPLRATVLVPASGQLDSAIERPWKVANWPSRLHSWNMKSDVDLHRQSESQSSPHLDWRGDVAALQAAGSHRYSLRTVALQVPDRGRHPQAYRTLVWVIAVLTWPLLRRAPRSALDMTFASMVRAPEHQTMVKRYGWRHLIRHRLRAVAIRAQSL